MRIDRENRELEEAIAARDEAVAAAARDRARCHTNLAAVAEEEVARAEAAEEQANVAAGDELARGMRTQRCRESNGTPLWQSPMGVRPDAL
jgi:hypothetical protein